MVKNIAWMHTEYHRECLKKSFTGTMYGYALIRDVIYVHVVGLCNLHNVTVTYVYMYDIDLIYHFPKFTSTSMPVELFTIAN